MNAPSGGASAVSCAIVSISRHGMPARLIPVSIARCHAPPPARSHASISRGKPSVGVRRAVRARVNSLSRSGVKITMGRDTPRSRSSSPSITVATP